MLKATANKCQSQEDPQNKINKNNESRGEGEN